MQCSAVQFSHLQGSTTRHLQGSLGTDSSYICTGCTAHYVLPTKQPNTTIMLLPACRVRSPSPSLKRVLSASFYLGPFTFSLFYQNEHESIPISRQRNPSSIISSKPPFLLLPSCPSAAPLSTPQLHTISSINKSRSPMGSA